MRPGRLWRSSVQALLAHRLRVTLTAASVAIGVAAVLVTSALGQGARDAVLRDVARMGENLLVVRPAQVERHVARPTIRGRAKTLRMEDRDALLALASVREAAASAEEPMRVAAGRRSSRALVVGTSASFLDVRGLRLRAGRFIGPEEEPLARRVAVLGARAADTLFPGREGVGETLRIRGVPFEVIGVLEARGVLADGSDEDGNVFVPIKTALRRVLNATSLTAIFVAARRSDDLDRADGEIRQLLRDRHRLVTGRSDDFDIQNQARLLATREELARSLGLLATGLAGAALVVGGTGVLAFMLLSVRERAGEIGLRTALGARGADIFLQFLVEASVLAIGGWLVGALLGAALLAVVAGTTEWAVGLSIEGAFLTLVTTALAGVGLGALPARKAARLRPVEALRSAS